MIELIFSALITIWPDYLYRRYVQDKRIGRDITLFNVWYELRWGITSCAILAISLITVIFYFHPTATHVTSLFRTVSVLSDRPGRVAEVYVADNETVAAGTPLFRLDTTRQEATAETARRRLAEIEAQLQLADSDRAAAQARLDAAEATLRQADEDLARREEIADRNASVVAEQELDRLRTAAETAASQRDAARAARDGVELRIARVLPAQKASAQALLDEATNEIAKSTVHAGVAGTVKQFKLQPGDIVNPILRPAGILVPSDSGRGRFQAGFGQMAAQVLEVGMLTEITCASQPLKVVPMVITEIQDAIATGQLRPTDQLIDIQDRRRPGTILAVLEPVFPGHADAILPGSACAGVAYTNRAAEREADNMGGMRALVGSVVDGMGIANAFVLRIQAVLLPVKALVFNR